MVACVANSVSRSTSFSAKCATRSRPKASDELVVSKHGHEEERPKAPSSWSKSKSLFQATEFIWGCVGDVERRLACNSDHKSCNKRRRVPPALAPTSPPTRRGSLSAQRDATPLPQRDGRLPYQLGRAVLRCRRWCRISAASHDEPAMTRSTAEKAACCRRTSASSFCRSETA